MMTQVIKKLLEPRLPTIDELKTLVYCSDGKYDTDGSCANYTSVAKPTINETE